MGNRQANTATLPRPSCDAGTTTRAARKRYQQQQHQEQHYANDSYRSKTLPARRTQNVNMHPRSQQRRDQQEQHRQQQQQHNTAERGSNTKRHTIESSTTNPNSSNNGETSRVLFLLYLIHRTWNVVVDTVDTRSKSRSRSNSKTPVKFERSQQTPTTATSNSTLQQQCSNLNHKHDLDDDCTITITDLDDIDASSYCSQYSCCSCSYCYDDTQNVYNSIAEDCSTGSICARTVSPCESDFSVYYQHDNRSIKQQEHQHKMAPSVCQNSPKLAPHNGNAKSTVSINGGGIVGVSGAGAVGSNTSSITQKSNCGSNSLNGSMASYKMTSSEQSWPQAVFSKENQRPPVYNPEDYVHALKKFGKRQNGNNATGQTPRSIYDASADVGKEENVKAATLPTKHSEYKSPIPAPPESDCEMTLRQFASITDLLTKLRADLRVSFPSFVQEFVATPSDGISLLLEVLRAIQLAQASNAPLPAMAQNGTASMPRNPQSYQRRALLDELACLQCLSICCSRSLDATARLGNTPVGLMPLASSATGQGIRARILALQLLSGACDKQTFGHGSQKVVAAGHSAVSEAMSTLRLRCSEPVRFRLLIGMLNSGGGSGELQCAGVKFINTFLESAVNLQQRLYLQAELFQAGFEPATLARTISSSSPWLDALRSEIKRFNELYVDVDKMINQARDADRVRSQMVILERRVQILHEEKAVLTSMERRLQERCAELQREIFRLQGAQHENSFKPVDKDTPVALPRQVPPNAGKPDSSEHEDEGISSSETGPSLSPVPILVLPQNKQTKHKKKTASSKIEDNDAATIEDVILELDNIVSEAEKQMSKSSITINSNGDSIQKPVEKDIVPVNIVPQPPRKSRSLAHLVTHMEGSELDGSEYGMLLLQNHVEHDATERVAALHTFFDEVDYDLPDRDKSYAIESPDIPEANANITACNASTNRELLDVIMNARHTDDDPTMKALRNSVNDGQTQTQTTNGVVTVNNKRSSYVSATATADPVPPAQQFNGVFFMTGMNTPQKYPKPDLTAALQARRVTKNIERLEAAFANSTTHEALNEVTIVREKSRSNQQIYFGSNPTLRLNTTDSTNGGGGGGSTSNHIIIGIQQNQQISTRTRSYTQGSKVTDLPSGLY